MATGEPTPVRFIVEGNLHTAWVSGHDDGENFSGNVRMTPPSVVSDSFLQSVGGNLTLDEPFTVEGDATYFSFVTDTREGPEDDILPQVATPELRRRAIAGAVGGVVSILDNPAEETTNWAAFADPFANNIPTFRPE